MDKIYIYADESSQDAQQFMLLGGIAVRAHLLKEIEQAFSNLRVQTNMTRELKWSKVTNQKTEEYRRFIDLFFELLGSGKLSFHCMILDSTKIKHKQFSESYELGFYKFFYQFLLHSFGKRYGHNNDLYVFLDQRQTGYKLDDLRTILNNGMKSSCNIDRRPFRLVEFADSKQSTIVQVADIILGAVGYLKNKRFTVAGAKIAKVELSAYVKARAKLKTDIPNTPYREDRFTVWNFMLK